MHIVIFAGGSLRPGSAVNDALRRADTIIAADGGAATSLAYGFQPSIVVGDFDSLASEIATELEQMQVQIYRANVEKDETDTELAIQLAIEAGADEISLLGALGGARFDHELGNLLLLCAFPEMKIRLIDGPSVCWLVQGPATTTIPGRSGDLLSLFPMQTEARGIRTTDLYYSLNNETLLFGRPRGISNLLTGDHASVSLESGQLLLIYTDQQELITLTQGRN